MVQFPSRVRDHIIFRIAVVIVLGASAALFRPGGEPVWGAVLVGVVIGAAGVLAEWRVARLTLHRLAGMGAGLIAGLICAALASIVMSHAGDSPGMRFAQIACLLVFGYLGAALGTAKGHQAFGGVLAGDSATGSDRKILDTSVIIDGRIADIAETGFLDGTLVVPQFVLQELQTVADSSDSMRRSRGRRGLDVLQRIQKMPNLKVQIVAQDFPQVREVDMKLIELARLFNSKIITNDFNLNKVAHVRGVEVLNINELTNSLKPIVLPGELMRVFILKEGKEYNQGVAYLDDGTMVVVDNARRMISKTIDISVTSVLQTTAGKMIFGKFDERTQSAAAGASTVPAADRRDSPRRDQAVGE